MEDKALNFTYETQGTNTFLVYTVSTEENIDSMTLGMLTNNKIPGLATTLFTQMDATKYIKYNVSAHIPASQFFAGAVNKKRLLGVFKGIVSAILSAEDYMIDENAVVLDLDYIFADVSTCETVLICLPVECVSQRNDLGAFFKSIMFTTQFDQTENCDYVARIINYLNSSPLFSLHDFNELLTKIENADVAPAPVVQSVQPKAPQPVQPQETIKSKPAVQPPAEPQQPFVPEQKPEFNAPHNVPIEVAKHTPSGVGPAVPPAPTMPAVPPVPSAPAQPNAGKEKRKGISLFGSLFSKEKKESKPQPAKKPAPQPARMAPVGFEVPNAPQPISKPVQQPIPQPAQQPMRQPQAVRQPVPQPVPRPVPQPVQQPIPQPMRQPVPQPVQQPIPQPMRQPVPQPVQPPIPQPVQQPAPQPIPQPVQQPMGMPLNFGETTVLSAKMGETTVLSSSIEPTKNDPHLIRTKNNEKIPLNKPVFRIGKERSYVDYFIGDNTAISRSHANIVNHNGDFFVVDTNSTNHTYVNGGMIQSGVETKLSHGTKIRLANEDFEFKMY